MWKLCSIPFNMFWSWVFLLPMNLISYQNVAIYTQCDCDYITAVSLTRLRKQIWCSKIKFHPGVYSTSSSQTIEDDQTISSGVMDDSTEANLLQEEFFKMADGGSLAQRISYMPTHNMNTRLAWYAVSTHHQLSHHLQNQLPHTRSSS